MTEKVAAVVLAGGLNLIPLYEGYIPGYKALLDFAGRPSVLYLLEALRGVPQVGRIALVGPTAELRRAVGGKFDCEFVEGEKTLGRNIFAGLRHFSGEPVLFVTADAPLITAEGIIDFLAACDRKRRSDGGEVFFIFVPQSSFTGPYAGRQKARLFFRDGILCHGNLALAGPGVADRLPLVSRIDQVYQARKETLKTILSFGWPVATSYIAGAWLLRRLSIEGMAGIASRRLGVRMTPILLDRPELVIDIDEAEDYAFVRRMLEERLPAAAGGSVDFLLPAAQGEAEADRPPA